MKKILSIATFLCFIFVGAAQAQEQETDYSPQKNDFMVSVNFGIGSHIGWSAPQPNLKSYSLAAPMSAWFDKKPTLGLEGRWFFTDKWALKLTGGFAYGYNPAYKEAEGTIQGEGAIPSGDIEIPTYKAIPKSENLQFSVGLGASRYYATKMDRLFLHIGGEFGFAYGRTSVNGEDNMDYMGASVGEAYALRVAPVCGFDYFFAPSLFIGVDFRPVAYQYSVYSERPQVGLPLLSSDNHSFSFIANPIIKFGFKF